MARKGKTLNQLHKQYSDVNASSDSYGNRLYRMGVGGKEYDDKVGALKDTGNRYINKASTYGPVAELQKKADDLYRKINRELRVRASELHKELMIKHRVAELEENYGWRHPKTQKAMGNVDREYRKTAPTLATAFPKELEEVHRLREEANNIEVPRSFYMGLENKNNIQDTRENQAGASTAAKGNNTP